MDVPGWVGMETFFSTLAQVAAGLLAIVFITFQIRIGYWRRDRLRHLVAIRTLGEFLIVMTFSQLCLAYPHAWRYFAAIMALVILTSVTYLQRAVLLHRRRLTKEARFQLRLTPIVDLEVGYILVTIVAGDLDWLPPLLLWFLFSRTAQAWRLMTPPAE
jgi:hypothetical protein